MKKIPLFFLFTLSLQSVLAQSPPIDSLKNLLNTTKEDTVKVEALITLSFYDPSFEHGLKLAQDALTLARQAGFEKGEAHALHQIGNQYTVISNNAMALHYYLEALQIREKLKDENAITHSYADIANIYQEEGDYDNSMKYYRRYLARTTVMGYDVAVIFGSLGSLFSLLNQQDSALKYYQRSYEIYNSGGNKYQLNSTLDGLGSVQSYMGNPEIALGYYRQSLRNGLAYNDTFGLSNTNLKIAQLYNKASKIDSSIFYAEQCLLYSQRAGFLKNISASGRLLSQLYENKDARESLLYLQTAQRANDSLFDRAKMVQMQNMITSESEREKENAEKEALANAEQKKNLQYASIALGIITLLIFYLLLSRSFITNTKLIEFFGVIALLIVFEFLNLLLHPFLEKITNHSPLIMLLVLVCIAAILVPLHHRLSKWATKRLVEKNKQIRLAAAQKTIEDLGGK